MRILWTGGGTLGSVNPLLATREVLAVRHPNLTELWIGTRQGIEQSVVSECGIPFAAVASGKLRRYFSLQNFLDPFLLLVGVVQSLYHIIIFRPEVIVSAGGSVAVPVLWAGWLVGVPGVILQLDVRPGMANLITAFCAKMIATSFIDEKQFFPIKKTTTIGVPVRRSVYVARSLSVKKDILCAKYGLDTILPILFVVGGSTGGEGLNRAVYEALPELLRSMQVVHLTGKGKHDDQVVNDLTKMQRGRYHAFPFLTTELVEYLTISDLVITRAGISMLSEAAVLDKPMIIVPIPDSHQEENASFFERQGAGRYVSQKTLVAGKLASVIQEILTDEDAKKKFVESAARLVHENASETMAGLIEGAAKK